MKKKILTQIFAGVLLLSVILVSAGLITTYFERQTQIEVISAISVEGSLENDLGQIVFDGDIRFIWGEKITIFNIANKSIDVQIVSDNNESEIEVRYVLSENGLFDYVDGQFSNDIILTIDGTSNISFYPQYVISKPISGNYQITTSINPIV